MSVENVKCVRLATGEVLLGNVVETSMPDTLIIENPLLLAMAPDPSGRLMINMMDYMPFSDDRTYSFDRYHILNVFEPNKGLKNQFIQKQTGLVLNSGGILKP